MRDDTIYAIHHYAASCLDDETKKQAKRQSFYLRKYMRKCEGALIKIANYHMIWDFYGVKGVMKKVIHKAIKNFREGNKENSYYLITLPIAKRYF